MALAERIQQALPLLTPLVTAWLAENKFASIDDFAVQASTALSIVAGGSSPLDVEQLLDWLVTARSAIVRGNSDIICSGALDAMPDVALAASFALETVDALERRLRPLVGLSEFIQLPPTAYPPTTETLPPAFQEDAALASDLLAFGVVVCTIWEDADG